MSTSRSLRRAAERRVRKQARKDARQPGAPAEIVEVEFDADVDTTANPESENETRQQPEDDLPAVPEPRPVISESRREANRANAQLSTGPKTTSGKSKSSQNAVKTALTGRTVLLPGDDAERYADRLAEYDKIYRPMGVRETEVVQALCDTWWRLERIPGLIEALYCKGCNELNDRVRDVNPEARSTMLRIEARLAYDREFRNLELQERRLYRHAENLKAELAVLRKERHDCEAEQYAKAAMFYLAAKKDRKPFKPAELGFEFSVEEVENYLAARRVRRISDEAFAQENGQGDKRKTHSA